jgi:hypothetical protein
MRTFPTKHNRLVLLICSVMLLVLRVGGAHLHLCFDGQEALATVHLLDGGQEHREDGGPERHQDENLDDGASSLVKSFGADNDAPVLPTTGFLAFITLTAATIAPVDRLRLPSFDTGTCLLPPPRGPPDTTSA